MVYGILAMAKIFREGWEITCVISFFVWVKDWLRWLVEGVDGLAGIVRLETAAKVGKLLGQFSCID